MATSSGSANPQLFHCPTCGAALPAPGDVVSVRCEYCGSTVLVPAEYRKPRQPGAQDFPAPQYHQPVVINLGGPDDESGAARGASIGGLIGVLLAVCVVIAAVSAILYSTGIFTALGFIGNVAGDVAPAAATRIANLPTQAATPTVNPGYKVALQFGAEGIGAGQFQDSRYVAVDPQGNLFIAEYDSGRLQKFDPSGKFLQLINVPPDDQGYTTISDLAADYAGKIYVARRGDILIYNAADGTQAGKISGSFPDTWYETVVFDPANNLYAFHTSAGELDLIKFDSAGKQLYRKPQVTAGLTPKNQISSVEKMAVDGMGNLYMLDRSQYQVYKFDANGNFLDRFGGKGDGPGLLDNVSDLAVDGQGRVYVLNQDGIDIFDANGASLRLIPGDYRGYAHDIQIDPQGAVYIVTNAPQVYKYTIDWTQ